VAREREGRELPVEKGAAKQQPERRAKQKKVDGRAVGGSSNKGKRVHTEQYFK